MTHPLPVTLKETKFTRTVQLQSRNVKVKIHVNRFFNRGNQMWNRSRTFSCEDLNIERTTRLEMERALLNENGWGLDLLTSSLESWSL